MPFESGVQMVNFWLGQVRQLPVTWGLAVVFTRHGVSYTTYNWLVMVRSQYGRKNEEKRNSKFQITTWSDSIALLSWVSYMCQTI